MEKSSNTTGAMTPELESLFELLRFPSISTDSRHRGDVRACAEWLAGNLAAMGLESRVDDTPGHPVVLAKSEAKPDRPTVLIYGHYDVQPVDPLELWDTPPFEPVLREGRILARGATDNKGQLWAHALGVGAVLREEGDLPVNVILLFEGEEEVGSPNLGAYLEAHKDELGCDVIAVSDTGMVAPGVPTLGYGLRGIACCEVKVSAAKSDLHSGVYGGAVANPATALARLLATLHDANGRVAVAGFYDGVGLPEEWEREAWSALPIDESSILKETGAPALSGEEGFSSWERLWARPTAEINGMASGYQGEGSKTVLPSEAMAKLSFRLVPGQDPGDILAGVRRHFEERAAPGIRLQFVEGHSGEPYFCDPRSRHGQAACEALREAFGREPVMIREGGSIPIINTFRRVLGVDTLLLGLALPDCRIHAPNENFTVENFEGGIRMNRALLRALAKA